MARAVLAFAIFCLFQTVRSVDWKRHQIYGKIYNNTKTKMQEHPYRNNPQHNVGNVLDLFNMIKCATTCDPWDLNNYGNFCGLGGSGVPIDDIDSCCEQHDACYDDNVKLYRCSKGDVYAWPYTWSCNYGYPTCSDGFNDNCGFWTCVCDKAFVECVDDAGCPRV